MNNKLNRGDFLKVTSLGATGLGGAVHAVIRCQGCLGKT